MSAIRTSGLSKRYGDTLALDGLELDVREGEVYGYLGPNGGARRRPSGCCSACTGRAGGIGAAGALPAVAAFRRRDLLGA